MNTVFPNFIIPVREPLFHYSVVRYITALSFPSAIDLTDKATRFTFSRNVRTTESVVESHR
jgi:hypothetical protein